MDIAILVMIALALGGYFWASARARARRHAALAQKASLLLAGRVEATAAAASTARFQRDGLGVDLWFEAGAQGPRTRVAIDLAGDLPGCGDLEVSRKGRHTLASVRDRGPDPKTGVAAFDASFRLEADRSDHGLVVRWMDEAGRDLVQKLSDLQGDDDDPVVHLDAGAERLHLWAHGYKDDGRYLESLVDMGLRLARRLTGKEAPPPEAPAAAPMEV